MIRKGGVYFVKAQTVNACVRADGCTQKTLDEYELMGKQKNCCVQDDWFTEKLVSSSRCVHKTYELTHQKNHAYKMRKCKIHAYRTVHVSECGRMVELKSFTKIREIVRVKMLT